MAFRGAIYVTSLEGVISPEYVVLRPRAGVDAEYLALVYRTPMYVAEFGRRSRGIGDRHFRLHMRDFGHIPVALPPDEDLADIRGRLKQLAGQHERVAATAGRMARLLRERRTAIITYAVEV